jgi:hypothetical protein
MDAGRSEFIRDYVDGITHKTIAAEAALTGDREDYSLNDTGSFL